ncbi:MAG: hypothetical protein U1D41_14955 [Nitrosomonas sp.]|uniref:hypothetical protein n=1 Tax=Betaproteobacteria TaxID=28216 RepID=UPI001222F1AF|nr:MULTISPECIES: hypothetical protein [Betaproteobacteria]MBA4316578.1 hypothetical protein [Alcaligenaceae bacterium]MDZ4107427.1 hypothetical protein [Nitrosomonas sp.]RZO94549.1 MAG: hypothetical protein EVA59_02050 [Limnobacter sp.]
MKAFEHQDVQLCAYLLSEAKTPDDALIAWSSMQAQYPDLVGIVCLDSYRRSALPPSVKKYTNNPLNYLVPYFESEHIYFLEDDLLRDMFSSNEVKFGVDYTLMLDTNIASYINKLVRGESLGGMQNKIIPLIDEILHDDLNFDTLFYMVENVKNVINLIGNEQSSTISFWRSLDKDFRSNLVSLQIFRSIDCKEYKRTSNPKPIFTYRNAARRAINFAYDFYASEIGKEHILDFVLVQRLILLQLIGMVKIQLSSNRSARKKMADYFDYIHEVVGAYFDRESIIAHKYFLNRNSVGILNKIQKGMPISGLLKKLDNIAWDMAAPRFMEKLIISMTEASDGRYFIPMFVSFDNKLRELLSLFPVKGAIFSKSEGELIPLPKINTMDYFQSHGCGDYLEHLFSDSVKTERMSRPKPTRLSVHSCIKREYRALREVISPDKKIQPTQKARG